MISAGQVAAGPQMAAPVAAGPQLFMPTAIPLIASPFLMPKLEGSIKADSGLGGTLAVLGLLSNMGGQVINGIITNNNFKLAEKGLMVQEAVLTKQEDTRQKAIDAQKEVELGKIGLFKEENKTKLDALRSQQEFELKMGKLRFAMEKSLKALDNQRVMSILDKMSVNRDFGILSSSRQLNRNNYSFGTAMVNLR